MGLYCLRGYLVLVVLVLINLSDGVSHALFFVRSGDSEMYLCVVVSVE